MYFLIIVHIYLYSLYRKAKLSRFSLDFDMKFTNKDSLVLHCATTSKRYPFHFAFFFRQSVIKRKVHICILKNCQQVCSNRLKAKGFSCENVKCIKTFSANA